MKRSTPAVGAVAAILVLLALAAAYRAFQPDVRPTATEPPPVAVRTPTAADEAHPSFLYGRIATIEGGIYEGRLRWGGGEEAFWGNYFNGAKKENPWVAYVPAERLPKERDPITIFGMEIVSRERPIDLGRLFMARFGDIARIEAGIRDVRVILKSGTTFDLNRSAASDFDDGVRVWDGKRGVADLDSLRIRAIDLLPGPGTGAAPDRLYGVVRTRQGSFTGFVQWDREECLGSDELEAQTADGEVRLRFGSIRSIARTSPESSVVTMLDGREVLLSGRAIGRGNRGVYVDDPRYGRVLVPWGSFEGIEFSSGGSGPAYADFPPGGPLTGAVVTRAGRRFAGRLVFDLDESEVIETLDAPSQGVDYTIPFGRIASIVLPGPGERGARRARVSLHGGEELQLECSGDLGDRNGGMLIFMDDPQRPEYVPWADVERVEFDRRATRLSDPSRQLDSR